MLIALFVLAATARSEESPAAPSRLQVVETESEIEIRQVEPEPPAEDETPALVLPEGLGAAELARRYRQAYLPEHKAAVLERLARTPPATPEDARWLLNLYGPDLTASAAAERSLTLLTPADQALAPHFLALARSEEPSYQLFGLLGAYHLRAAGTLDILRELAGRRFEHPRPALTHGPDANYRWQLQFEALRMLAAWGGREALPFLEKRSGEAPAVAAILAEFFWAEALPKAAAWSESRRAEDQARAAAAWAAPVPVEALRPAWPRLKELVLDRSKREETRHRAAVKLGAASGDAEAQALAREREGASDPKTRLLLAAALFASRRPAAIPLLKQYVQSDPDPASRAGALVQLAEMLPRPEHRALLEWVAAHDQDPGNRENARKELANNP